MCNENEDPLIPAKLLNVPNWNHQWPLKVCEVLWNYISLIYCKNQCEIIKDIDNNVIGLYPTPGPWGCGGNNGHGP